MNDPLTFAELRTANQGRLPSFGVACQQWEPRDWMLALIGEVGELANIMKKVSRGDEPLGACMQEVRDELADIQTYLDLLSASLRVDLGHATRSKFNLVSERVGSQVKL